MRLPWTGGSHRRRNAAPIAAATLAHGGPTSGGLVAGVVHPSGGIDRLLAMVAVGPWATRQGGRFWLLATFNPAR